MNNFLNRLEFKFGRYAIKNLTKYILACYALGYALQIGGMISNRQLLEIVLLDPYKIMHGQIWRILTWIIVPPESLSIFTVIMFMFYYFLGSTLERTWGTFRFNIYILSGIIFTVIGAFIMYFAYYAAGYFAVYGADVIGYSIGVKFNTYYINMVIFLAVAVEYANMQVLLMMFIPVKMKWLAIADGILILYSFLTGSWETKVVITASLLNFILFFILSRDYKRIAPGEARRRRTYKKETAKPFGVTKHKCAICGRTEKDGDELEFRFCSKCNGNYEYCQDHLFTHEHVK